MFQNTFHEFIFGFLLTNRGVLHSVADAQAAIEAAEAGYDAQPAEPSPGTQKNVFGEFCTSTTRFRSTFSCFHFKKKV